MNKYPEAQWDVFFFLWFSDPSAEIWMRCQCHTPVADAENINNSNECSIDLLIAFIYQ